MDRELRFLVTGGRMFGRMFANEKRPEIIERVRAERQFAHSALSKISGFATLVHGDASGADRLCANLWKGFGNSVEAHPANWSVCADECQPEHRKRRQDGTEYCPTAGIRRNQEMLDSGIDLCIAFAGGTGTADMVKRATKAGIEIIDLRNS